MSNLVPATATSTSLVDWSQDPFEQIANTMAQTGTPLKFSKGKWYRGYGNDERPADGMTLIADVQGIMVGWRCWKDRKIVDAAVGFVAENFKPPQRNDLGDLDESAWERDANGNPKDPWVFGFYIRLTDDDGEAYVYSATSNGARRAVFDLIKEFTKRRKKDPAHCVPVVRLMADSYRHKDYGRIDTPKLAVIDWHDSGAAVASIPSPDGSDDVEMGDTIPF